MSADLSGPQANCLCIAELAVVPNDCMVEVVLKGIHVGLDSPR